MSKFLYLPLEIVYREHDAKSAIAAHAASQGWTVIIAPKLSLYKNLKNLPKGVFLIKSAVPSEFKQIKALKDKGHKVFSFDEEGVVTYEIFLEGDYRYNKETVDLLDGIFFWGKKQHSVFLKNLPSFENKSHVVGNPRVEFWREYARKVYEDESKEIRKRYGDFVFIPTSFGIANNYLQGNQGVELSLEMFKEELSHIRAFLEGQRENNLIVFKEYIDFIPLLAREIFPKNIIIRPHPSESQVDWEKISQENSNIFLEYSGSVTPWILASKIMIHFKSTTSIESNLMDIPTLTYIPSFPEYMDKFELELPKAISHPTFSRHETIKSVKDFFNGKKINKPLFENNEWIFIDKNKSETKNLMKFLEENSMEVDKPISFNLNKYNLSLREIYEIILDFFNSFKYINRNLPSILKRNPLRQSYGKRKYLGMNLKHTEYVVNKIFEIEGFHKNVEVRELIKDIYLIRAKDDK